MKRIESAFDSIGKDLSGFAERHSLFVHKSLVYNPTPSWSLDWRRRVGGIAGISIIFRPERPEMCVDITAGWSLDDYPSETRLGRDKLIGTYSLDQPRDALGALLQCALETVDAWGKEDLDERYPSMGWKNKWKTQAEFEREVDKNQPFHEYHVR